MDTIQVFMVAFLLISDTRGDERSQVPAMFVFGDSLSDPGNNNRLVTFARADFYPNGIDFPSGATGRFCNGLTTTDYLGSFLGLPLIPPFNNPKAKGTNLLHGVNFASAASGILNDTGKIYGNNFQMDKQIQNFKRTIEELNTLLGQNGTTNLLARSLFSVSIGSNDYINNYLILFSDKPSRFSPDAYSQMLIEEYTRQLKDIYNTGGRKFLISGLAPMGCIPQQIWSSGNNIGACIDSTNRLAMQFNNKLRITLQELNSRLQGSYFLYWDTYNLTYRVLDNSLHYGFKYINKACCGAGRSNGQIICLPELPLECSSRSEYMFWDMYHPTDAFNAIAAKDAYEGTLQSSFPMNVRQLVQS